MIVQNAGADPGKVLGEIERQQKEKNDPNIGYNVVTMQYSDMVKEGIIDPAKVARSATQNAVSVAIMVLTTECLVAEAPKKEEPAPGGAGAGMGGMGGMGDMGDY